VETNLGSTDAKTGNGNGTHPLALQRIQDIFGPGSNPQGRIIRDYSVMAQKVAACKNLGLRISMTQGSFDLFHEGHARYLEMTKQHGDVVVVGVDSDAKVRKRKGPNRPIVAEDSRMEILCHCRHVDLVFLKQPNDAKWELIRTVRPDVLIATQDNYKSEEIAELERELCGKVLVLGRQAAESTTARVRKLLIDNLNKVRHQLAEVIGTIDELANGGKRGDG